MQYIQLDTCSKLESISHPVKKMTWQIENLKEGETYDDSIIADAKSVSYYKYLLASLPKITYDITSTERGEAVRSYSYYIKNKYDYIITSDLITWRTKVPA